MSKVDRRPQLALGLLAVLASCQLLDGTGNLTFKNSGPTGSGGGISTSGVGSNGTTTGASMDACSPEDGDVFLLVLAYDLDQHEPIAFRATLKKLPGSTWRLDVVPLKDCDHNVSVGPSQSSDISHDGMNFTFHNLNVLPAAFTQSLSVSPRLFKSLTLNETTCTKFACGIADGDLVGPGDNHFNGTWTMQRVTKLLSSLHDYVDCGMHLNTSVDCQGSAVSTGTGCAVGGSGTMPTTPDTTPDTTGNGSGVGGA